jgi:hypothetical protein
MEEFLAWGTPTAPFFLAPVGLAKTSSMNMGEQLLTQWTYTKAQRVAASFTPRPTTLYTEQPSMNNYDDVAVVGIRGTHERTSTSAAYGVHDTGFHGDSNTTAVSPPTLTHPRPLR